MWGIALLFLGTPGPIFYVRMSLWKIERQKSRDNANQFRKDPSPQCTKDCCKQLQTYFTGQLHNFFSKAFALLEWIVLDTPTIPNCLFLKLILQTTYQHLPVRHHAPEEMVFWIVAFQTPVTQHPNRKIYRGVLYITNPSNALLSCCIAKETLQNGWMILDPQKPTTEVTHHFWCCWSFGNPARLEHNII